MPADGHDDAAADLFDELLQQLLEGETPDLEAMAQAQPERREQIQKAWSLASSVAGRREPGRPTLGGYEILRELGRGGMGTVYLARHQNLGREVAVKVLPPSLGLSPSAKRRFLEEARALARLRNDHIVRIHHIIDSSDMLAFEMEYVDGSSLTALIEHLRQRGRDAALQHVAAHLGGDVARLGARTLVEYFVRLGIDIARALHEVHHSGLVHRDVKPSNILLRRDGRPLLADFGLARGLDLTVTRQGAFAGTPIYAPPEQLRGEELDPRADVYALAVTLYEAIALAPPLSGSSTADVLRRIEEGRIPPLRQKAPQVSRDLEIILGKAMETQQRDRYASAAEFANDLERLLHLQPIQARPAGVLRRTTKFARRQHRTILAGLVGAVLVAAAMVPFFGRADAEAAARVRATELLRSARLQLLSPESRRIAWSQAVWGNGPRLRQLPATASDPVATLQQALADYDAALALRPDDAATAMERNVVAMVLVLRTQSPQRSDMVAAALDSPTFQEAAERLPPLTRAAARQFVDSQLDRGFDVRPLVAQLPQAQATDRMALGLLGFLLGEFQLCEQSWVGVEGGVLATSPLLDAGLGILYQADSRAERAFLRLSAARQSFPESPVIALDLADAALELGELPLARALLAQSNDDANGVHRQRLQAELLAAEGDLDGARAGYEALVQREPMNPQPCHRLALLQLASGDLAGARQRLDRLLREWPDVARYRLDRARLALQQHDVGTYLAQACYVVANDFGRGRSDGCTRDLLEILRLGGLHGLLQQGIAATGANLIRRRWTGEERPFDALVGAMDQQRLEQLITGIGCYQHEVGQLLLQSESDRGIGQRVQAFAGAFPGSIGFTGLGAQLVAAVLPAVTDFWWRRLPQPWFGLQLDLGMLSSDGRVAPVLPFDRDPNLMQGAAMAPLADIDGDGVADLVVGCPPFRPEISQGRVRVIASRHRGVQFEVSDPSPTQLFGFAVDDAGDFDGDGVGDWIVGAPIGVKDYDGPGMAYVYSGRDGARLSALCGDRFGFGVSVAGLGDLDGDGCSEVVVGTSPVVHNRMAQGGARMFAGKDGHLLRTFRCDQAGVFFGSAVAAAGDVDGDGVTDLIVGGNHGFTAGLVKVYSGRTGAVLFAWYDDSTSTGFGSMVDTAGDLDGDGHADLLVGACGSYRRFADHGRVFVFAGGDGRVLATFDGHRTNDAFGYAALPFCDFDGDGVLDYAIASPLAAPRASGLVEVYSGSSGRVLATYRGPLISGCFGQTLAVLPGSAGKGTPLLMAAAPVAGGAAMAWRIMPNRR